MQQSVDTDTIISMRHLMAHGREELGPYSLESLRFRPDGSEDANCVLNQPKYREAVILITGENFGCGSSREAAVWSLLGRGIRCIISPSFGDIFHSNCLQNGLLPVVLPAAEIQRLAAEVAQSADGSLTVDLPAQRVIYPTGYSVTFSMDRGQRHALLEGLDEIGMTLKLESSIAAYQQKSRAQHPWMYELGTQRRTQLLMLPGDGIGSEVMAQVKRVVQWFIGRRNIAADLHEELYGIPSWRVHGQIIGANAWDAIRGADAILFGATGSPEYESIPRQYWMPDNLFRIRKELGLFANLRPVRMYDALSEHSTLRPEVVRGADLMIVREIAGGVHFGLPRGIEDIGNGERRAVNTISYTTKEIERIARVAFEQARVRKNKVCSVDKANILENGMLWREVVQSVHDAEYPDIDLTHMYVDNAAMQLVRNPGQFDVILTDNMFGDILSDCAAMVAGSIGMLPSAALGAVDAQGRRRALYEPVHGSAPDLQGKHVANPLGAIMSFGMCLQYSLNKPQEAQLLSQAVERALGAGIRTADVAGTAPTVSTDAMGDGVIEALESIQSNLEMA
jgi:3-isopropylmalate dehydrogenase